MFKCNALHGGVTLHGAVTVAHTARAESLECDLADGGMTFTKSINYCACMKRTEGRISKPDKH